MSFSECMNRNEFLKMITMMPASGLAYNVKALAELTDPLALTEKMPVFFFGHGSPMNALEQNQFTAEWQRTGRLLPKPNAVLCISAHWLTQGTWVTAMERPRTIHDFGGFPQALFDVQYPAAGSPAFAEEVVLALKGTTVGKDEEWGLDHGCWSVLKHLYPEADVPVIQMSIDYRQPASYHYELAKQLASLRHKGVLIVGSGNMVHNLGMVAWDKLEEPGYGYDWAIEANEKMKGFITDRNHDALLDYHAQGPAMQLAIPTPDHYYPMIYALALQEQQEGLSFFNDEAVMGSLTMTSFRIQG